MSYYNYSNPAELYHHGILGQKWGKRNGPPYPLGYNQHSAKEKRENPKSSITPKTQKEMSAKEAGDVYDAINHYRRQQMMKRAGMVAGAAALTAIGGYALYKSGALDDLIDKGKYVYVEVPDKPKISYSDKLKPDAKALAEKLGLKEIENPSDVDPRILLSAVNPELDREGLSMIKGIKTNADFQALSTQDRFKYMNFFDRNNKWLNNCSLCTTTYELRKRGLDVSAAPSITGKSLPEIASWFKGASWDSMRLNPLSQTIDFATVSKAAVSKYPEGARGNIGVFWKDGGGHSMIWEITNGQLVIRDGQINVTYDTIDKLNEAFGDRINTAAGLQFLRTDDKELHIDNIIKSGVINLKRV